MVSKSRPGLKLLILPCRFRCKRWVNRNANVPRHPNCEISNHPPSTILAANGDFRLRRIPKFFDITCHLLGFFQHVLEGEAFDVGIPASHWLGHKPFVSKVGNIFHEMVNDSLIFRHDALLISPSSTVVIDK